MQSETRVYDTKAKEAVKSLAAELGFDLVGVTSADPFYEAEEITLERVRDGLMDGLPWYHAARVKRGCNPQEMLPGARSIIAVAMSYMAKAPPQIGESTPLQGKVARYAWGQDYHKVMERRLKLFVQRLSERLGQLVQAKVYVDTGPMLDRAVAERAGIGWFGKNTNILTRSHGSWVFLGQVITDLELEPDSPSKKTCGQCTICIDKCPTGALIAPYVLDNTKCISYLTIECRGPKRLRPLVGDWVFGCDICQDLRPLIGDTEEEFRERFANSPIKRAKRAGMLRNVCVALGCDICQDVCPVNRKALPTQEPAFQTGEHGFTALELLPLLKITEEDRSRICPLESVTVRKQPHQACEAPVCCATCAWPWATSAIRELSQV